MIEVGKMVEEVGEREVIEGVEVVMVEGHGEEGEVEYTNKLQTLLLLLLILLQLQIKLLLIFYSFF